MVEIKIETLDRLRSKFIEIYKDGKEARPIPMKEKITVFCDSNIDGEFYVPNCTYSDLGMELFCAKSWILQNELKALVENI